jgi:hypothetical protein
MVATIGLGMTANCGTKEAAILTDAGRDAPLKFLERPSFMV